MAGFQVVRSEDNVIEIERLPRVEEGSAFGWDDRISFGSGLGNFDPNIVFDFADWEARDIEPFLRQDYKARQILNVKKLPVESAERSIKPAKGDKGEFEWLQEKWDTDPLDGGCEQPLDYIINQAMSGVAYKRAYFEKTFEVDDDEKIFYKSIAFRPQTTCRLAREAKTGKLLGFQQQPFTPTLVRSWDDMLIDIPLKRAFIYIHGNAEDPMNGTSDLEIPYWCYKTKQKVMLLWFQFLEGVALPRLMIGANEIGDAQSIARQAVGLRNSGALPYAFAGGAQSVKIDTVDMSGKGADQFLQCINFLDKAAVDAVLAGFLNLTNSDKSGGGYSLSKDASDFYLQSEEALTRELATAVRRDVFAPVVRANFRNGKVPLLVFEPLADGDQGASIELLTAMIQTPPGSENPVPTEFVSELSEKVANELGLDGDKVAKAFTKASKAAKAKAALMGPMGASPTGQAVAGVAGAVNAAQTVVNGVKQAQGPQHDMKPLDPSTVTSPHGQEFLRSIGVPV